MTKQTTEALQVRFGLQVDPFAPGALPDFFFVGGQRRFLAQRVVHALYFSGGVVLLKGERGAGKSRVIDAVINDLSELTDSCRIEANVMMDGAEIRRLLAASLGLAATAAQDSTTLSAAFAQWQPVEIEPQPIALIIDDAQLLAVPVLAECLALVHSTAGRLRLLLAGEPELIAAWEQCGGGATECIELPPLDRQETADYVLTRLQAAGYRAETPLSEQQLRALYQQSRGNIAAIHAWMSALTADVISSGPHDFASTVHRFKSLPLRHIGVAAGLLGVVAILMLFRGHDKGEYPVSVASTSIAKAVPGKAVEQRSVPLTLPLAAAPIEQPPTQVQAAAPQSPKAALQPQSDMVSAAPVEKVAMPPPSAQPIVASSVAPPITKPTISKPALTKTIAAPAVAQQAVGDTVGREQTADERELLTWRADQFALQLLGAESEVTVAKFVSDLASGIKLYSYRTRHQDRPWNIVVMGPFADRNSALTAVAALPQPVSARKPWPRTVASIQAEIRAQH